MINLPRLLTSSKSQNAWFAIAGMFVLAAFGKITFEQLTWAVTAIVAALNGSVALEDAASKRAGLDPKTGLPSVRPPPPSILPGTPTDKLPPPPGMPTDVELPSLSRSIK
jgi:hypothetical protein